MDFCTLEHIRKKWANFRHLRVEERIHVLVFKKCCFFVPLRIGVSFLFALQLASLTPFAVYARCPHCLKFVTVLLVLTSVAAVLLMWSVLYTQPQYITICVYLSFGDLIFHFAMLDHLYGIHRDNKKEERVDRFFFIINVFGVVSYVYLFFMLYNIYNKTKRVKERLSLDSIERV